MIFLWVTDNNVMHKDFFFFAKCSWYGTCYRRQMLYLNDMQMICNHKRTLAMWSVLMMCFISLNMEHEKRGRLSACV